MTPDEFCSRSVASSSTQIGFTPPLQAGGRRFDPGTLHRRKARGAGLSALRSGYGIAPRAREVRELWSLTTTHRPVGGLRLAGGTPTPPVAARSAGPGRGDPRNAEPSPTFRGAVGSTRVSRLLVLGDLHCDRRHLRDLVERALEERCNALLSLGDLCYLPRDPEGRRFLRSSGALLRRGAPSSSSWREPTTTPRRSPAPKPEPRGRGTVPLGFRLHHLPAGTRFTLGRLRCLAYGGAFPARPPQAGRDWYRAVARERAAFERVAGGGAVDLLFCHDPRTLEQGAQARGSFAALAAKLRPALVFYAHQHRPYVSAGGQPALVGLGSFKDGIPSAVVLDSAETGRLVRALRDRQSATHPEAAGPARHHSRPPRSGREGRLPQLASEARPHSFAAAVPSEAVYGVEFPFGTETSVIKVGGAERTDRPHHGVVSAPPDRRSSSAGQTRSGQHGRRGWRVDSGRARGSRSRCIR